MHTVTLHMHTTTQYWYTPVAFVADTHIHKTLNTQKQPTHSRRYKLLRRLTAGHNQLGPPRFSRVQERCGDERVRVGISRQLRAEPPNCWQWQVARLNSHAAH